MRAIHILPFAAAMLLASCGSGESDADADGDGALSGEEIAAESASAIQLQPGEYEVSLELLEFEVPGLPAEFMERARQAYASGMSSHRFCMTAEDVANNGAEQLVKNMADSPCTMRRFDVSGGSVSSEMQCSMEGGITSEMRMEGELTSQGSVMTTETTQVVPDAGETRTKVRMTTQRVGDCPA